ncbi:cystathionine gamma-synthase [Martiniozyma asiatica (nom. inval.)]|nr:cystathionine gamma-synthase [Martiniozyma asiatica]
MPTPSQSIGAPIPNNTPHAVSVTLPTWEATVGYEEGESWVVDKMNSGYPRFFIHSQIQTLCKLLEASYAREDERCMIFPSYKVAKRAREFIKKKSLNSPPVRILQLSSPAPTNDEEKSYRIEANISALFFPSQEFSLAKQYWQHSGEGISSRLGEYFFNEMKDKVSIEASKNIRRGSGRSSTSRASRSSKSNRSSLSKGKEEGETFIEERFGRNLDLSFADKAKNLLKERLANEVKDVNKEDIYLYPSGMGAIFNAHRIILNTIGELPSNSNVLVEPSVRNEEKSVCFGFPYVDTLNILRKWGAGCHFYGFGDDHSLDDLERRLEQGERILSLFCEFPSNPLLKTPDIIRISELSKKYNFAVVIDETVANLSNVEVLPYADFIVSSLTKIFSGDSNVMAGCMILNSKSRYYSTFKSWMNEDYEDLFWSQDAIYLERNSRDFVQRSKVMNENAEAVIKLFQSELGEELIENIFYPSVVESKGHYDKVKKADGGYGALISIVFKESADAVCFFNTIELSKGPSLGTNFTLVCPYAILAHFQELDEVEKWGVDRNLVRMSIGMEKKEDLVERIREALECAKEQHNL